MLWDKVGKWSLCLKMNFKRCLLGIWFRNKISTALFSTTMEFRKARFLYISLSILQLKASFLIVITELFHLFSKILNWKNTKISLLSCQSSTTFVPFFSSIKIRKFLRENRKLNWDLRTTSISRRNFTQCLRKYGRTSMSR